MVELISRQVSILRKISKGKYVYPEREYLPTSQVAQDVEWLMRENLIAYTANPNNSGLPCFSNLKLTSKGVFEFEAREKARKKDNKLNVRYWITTAIAVVALILHWLK